MRVGEVDFSKVTSTTEVHHRQTGKSTVSTLSIATSRVAVAFGRGLAWSEPENVWLWDVA